MQANFVGQKWPFRCTRTTESKSCSLMLKMVASRVKPGLLTSTCRSPKRSTAVATSARASVPVGGVAEVPHRLTTPPADLLYHGVRRRLVAPRAVGLRAEIAHYHARAHGGEIQGVDAAEPVGRARHDRHLAVEFTHAAPPAPLRDVR